MSNPAQDVAAAEVFAHFAAGLSPQAVPAKVRANLTRSVLDVGGLMVAARNTDYVQATVAARDGAGTVTSIGHQGTFTATDAAIISGTAAHGEDFDDTLEGTPVHVGAVIAPAVLAAAEAHQVDGPHVLKGMAVGAELACRLGIVAPTAIHRAAFHPTAVCGALGAAAGIATMLRLSPERIAAAIGIAGSMASGIIEYLAEGTWTKRLHPGWAAQSGIRAARLAAAGFTGPRTVLDGVHGFYVAFAAPGIERDFTRITAGLGFEWVSARLAYKPYACGTMVQPYIDCAIELRRQGIVLEDIQEIVASVGEGTVHRLWEPIAEKQRPSTSYSAKFSGPYGIAIGLVDGAAGLQQYTDERIGDPRVLGLTEKVRFEVDPSNPYPDNYTGELRVTMADGHTLTALQPHMRGGVHEPLSDAEILEKFRANAAFGGWNDVRARAFEAFTDSLFETPSLAGLAEFRG